MLIFTYSVFSSSYVKNVMWFNLHGQLWVMEEHTKAYDLYPFEEISFPYDFRLRIESNRRMVECGQQLHAMAILDV